MPFGLSLLGLLCLPVSARRSAVPATRTDINNNTVLARANRSRAWKKAAVFAAGACAAGCEHMLFTSSNPKQGKAYTLLHVMYVLALHAQDNGCGNAAVFWRLSTLLCFPFVNHTWLPPSRAKDEIGSSHGNNNVNPSE
jgi:hypothetical protein